MSKERFRRDCRALLRRRSAFAKGYLDALARQQLNRFVQRLKVRHLLCYMPFGFEVDILPLMKQWRRQFEIFVPLMEDTSFRMVEYRLPLKKALYGIRQPSGRIYPHTRIDAAIVPVVGFDAQMHRIGYGKGMFDRFFASLGYKPITIFIQLMACRSNDILGEEHDIRADWVVTPKQILAKETNRYDRTYPHRRGHGGGRIFDRQEARRSQIRHLCRTVKGQSQSD